MPRFHPDQRIAEALAARPEAWRVFSELGLCCWYCDANQVETLAEGAGIHGYDLAALLERLNVLPGG